MRYIYIFYNFFHMKKKTIISFLNMQGKEDLR